MTKDLSRKQGSSQDTTKLVYLPVGFKDGNFHASDKLHDASHQISDHSNMANFTPAGAG